jgi:hypothetical protein
MPRTATDYSKSVIYKIEHIDKPELVYVGSTTNFINRKYAHKNNCNSTIEKIYNLRLYEMIRYNNGWKSFKMMIICEFPCNSKTELVIEEEKYRKELQASLNSVKAYLTIEESKILHREYSKEYRKNNNNKVKDYNKDYLLNNKEKYKEYKKIKVVCDCGSNYRKGDKLQHEKTKKHCQFIQQEAYSETLPPLLDALI